jgi:hypothetical protein
LEKWVLAFDLIANDSERLLNINEMAKVGLAAIIKMDDILLKTHYSITPLFHYSMIEARTHSKNILDFHLAIQTPERQLRGLSVFFPAVRPDKFNEAASSQIGFMDTGFVLCKFHEILGILITHRHHQVPPFRQLFQ